MNGYFSVQRSKNHKYLIQVRLDDARHFETAFNFICVGEAREMAKRLTELADEIDMDIDRDIESEDEEDE